MIFEGKKTHDIMRDNEIIQGNLHSSYVFSYIVPRHFH